MDSVFQMYQRSILWSFSILNGPSEQKSGRSIPIFKYFLLNIAFEFITYKMATGPIFHLSMIGKQKREYYPTYH